jgi:hypothetical protein
MCAADPIGRNLPFPDRSLQTTEAVNKRNSYVATEQERVTREASDPNYKSGTLAGLSMESISYLCLRHTIDMSLLFLSSTSRGCTWESHVPHAIRLHPRDWPQKQWQCSCRGWNSSSPAELWRSLVHLFTGSFPSSFGGSGYAAERRVANWTANEPVFRPRFQLGTSPEGRPAHPPVQFNGWLTEEGAHLQ